MRSSNAQERVWDEAEVGSFRRGHSNQQSFRILAGDAQLPAAEVLFALGHHLVAAGTELVGLLIADVPGEIAARDLVLARAAAVPHRLGRRASGRGEREQDRDR